MDQPETDHPEDSSAQANTAEAPAPTIGSHDEARVRDGYVPGSFLHFMFWMAWFFPLIALLFILFGRPMLGVEIGWVFLFAILIGPPIFVGWTILQTPLMLSPFARHHAVSPVVAGLMLAQWTCVLFIALGLGDGGDYATSPSILESATGTTEWPGLWNALQINAVIAVILQVAIIVCAVLENRGIGPWVVANHPRPRSQSLSS